MIGYFLRNEPHWAFGVYNLAERMLLQPERLGCRDRLIGWLKERHGGVEALNAAWGAGFGALDDLAAGAVAGRLARHARCARGPGGVQPPDDRRVRPRAERGVPPRTPTT